MGHQKAPSINGQSRTPHTDSNAYGNRQNIDAFTSRQTSGDGPRSYGAHLTNTSAPATGDLQQLTHFWVSPQEGAGLD